VEVDGEWFVRVAFPKKTRKANGKIDYIQIKRRCPEKTAEAAAALAEGIKQAYKNFTQTPADGEPLSVFIAHFLAAKKGALSRRVYESHEDYIERMLPAALGRTPIEKIRPLDIQKLYNELQKKYSPATLRKFHKLLTSIFTQAVNWDLITKNPCKGAVLPPEARSSIQSLDVKQAQKLLEVCRKNPDHFIFEFLLETGLRPSEALALTWDDIDERSVTVNKALVRGLKGGGYEIKKPKTDSSVRTIEISKQLSKRLVEHRTLQIDRIGVLTNKIREPLPKNKTDNYYNRKTARKCARAELKNLETLQLVFPSETGSYWSVGNLNRREFKKVAAAVGLKGKYSLYCLRHSMATLSLASGADIKTISSKLGHTDISLTLKVYSHVLDSMKSDATNKLASILYDSPRDPC
jgi:integrase